MPWLYIDGHECRMMTIKDARYYAMKFMGDADEVPIYSVRRSQRMGDVKPSEYIRRVGPKKDGRFESVRYDANQGEVRIPMWGDGSIMDRKEVDAYIKRYAEDDIRSALKGRCLSWQDLMTAIRPIYQHPIYRKTAESLVAKKEFSMLYVSGYPGPIRETMAYADNRIADRLRKGKKVKAGDSILMYRGEWFA